MTSSMQECHVEKVDGEEKKPKQKGLEDSALREGGNCFTVRNSLTLVSKTSVTSPFEFPYEERDSVIEHRFPDIKKQTKPVAGAA